MKYISVDVEADGQVPGINSMVCFGAVLVGDPTKTFYGQVKPISTIYEPDALAVSGFSRKEHEGFDDPVKVMEDFANWIKEHTVNPPIFITDNPAFDFAYMNYYFHVFYGKNPFGWSGRRIGDIFCGFYKDSHYRWKKHRVTKHTHNPVDDAMGNVEALHFLKSQGMNIKF